MKQILCFGDSNTYGLVPGTTKRYGFGVRWTGRLDEKMRKKGYRVIEEGLCGRTTVFQDPLREGRRGVDLLPVILETHKPVDTMILMLGTNDCKTIFDASAEVIGKGVERLLEQVKQVSPDTKVLLVSPIALGNRVWEEGYDTEFNGVSVGVSRRLPEVYGQIAKKREIAFLAASQYAQASEADREHLDEKGHEKLAEAVWNKLEEILGL